MSFKIATWNINSLRVRLPHVVDWLVQHQPDILTLQETKVPDPDFPMNELIQAGYHVSYSGQKAYNGVAILSREPGLDIKTDIMGFDDPQRRILVSTIADIRIINLYVPNGESLHSEKYQYKLHWLENVRNFIEQELQAHKKLIVLGDFNIAPEASDVHNVTHWEEGRIFFSEPEREALQQINQLGLVDCFRLFTQPEKSFSWWDYRLNAFKRNMGLRIDHILASQAMKAGCLRCYIDKTPRTAERPSDHAPVIAEFHFA